MPKAIDYTGKKYHRLTAMYFTGRYKCTSGNNKKRIWHFKCECGQEKDLVMEKVIRGQVKSCGCLKSTRTPIQVVQHQCFQEGYDDGDLTEEQFIELSQLPCHYCNKPPSNNRTHRYYKDISFQYNGLDRLDNSQTHNLNNVVPCCWICNNKKSNWNYQEFMNWINTIYHNRNNQ
jgi:hypothetical protein